MKLICNLICEHISWTLLMIIVEMINFTRGHLIFDRFVCILFSCFLKDNEFGRKGTRLKQIFYEEFQKIFSISIK